MDTWRLGTESTVTLTQPVPIDPKGRAGPTKGEARGSRWRRTSRGLYVPASVSRDVVEQRILEESGRLPPDGAVTGWAALRLHGAAYFDGLANDGRSLVDVPLVVRPGIPMRRHPGIEVHRERLDAKDLTHVHAIRVTTAERAAFDSARFAADLREAVVTLDMALAAGCIQIATFRTFVQTRAGWPGIRTVRAALDLADPRSMSPMETRLRLVWRIDAGLPAPRCNWPVADGSGTFIGRPDLLCEDLAVVGEYDGSEHRSRSRHRDDIRRDDMFRAVGLEPFRVVGADINDVAVVVERINAAVRRAQSSTTPRTWRIKRDPGRLR